MKERLKIEAKKALDKLFENANQKGMKWMREANRLSARPGEEESSTFLLPTHIEANYTPLQSAEAIANHFAKISQEFTPINEDISPKWLEVKHKLNETPCSHPDIQEHIVYENMKSAKKTDSVPGDIPSSILREFLPELATPVTAILKKSVETHTWPEIYKQEYHLPLKKIPAPETEDNLRGIGLTSFISKQVSIT